MNGWQINLFCGTLFRVVGRSLQNCFFLRFDFVQLNMNHVNFLFQKTTVQGRSMKMHWSSNCLDFSLSIPTLLCTTLPSLDRLVNSLVTNAIAYLVTLKTRYRKILNISPPSNISPPKIEAPPEYKPPLLTNTKFLSNINPSNISTSKNKVSVEFHARLLNLSKTNHSLAKTGKYVNSHKIKKDTRTVFIDSKAKRRWYLLKDSSLVPTIWTFYWFDNRF